MGGGFLTKGSWSDISGHGFVLQLTLLLCSVFYFTLGATTVIPIIMLSRIVVGIVYFFLSDIQNDHQSAHETDSHSQDEDIHVKSESHNSKASSSVINSRTINNSHDILQAVTNLRQINWPVYWDVFALKFLLGFAQAVHYQNFTLILKDMYDISPKWIGYIISLQGFVGALTGFTTEWISKFYKNDENNFHRTLHGFIILTISFVVISFAPSLTFVILCLIPLSAAGSLLRITTSAIIMQRTAPNQRGSLIGSGQSMSSVARLMAPLCSGIAYDMFNFKGIAILKISSSVFAVVLTAFLFAHQKLIKKVD